MAGCRPTDQSSTVRGPEGRPVQGRASATSAGYLTRMRSAVCARNDADEAGYETCRRHRDGYRLVDRQQHPGSAGEPARGEVRHRRAPTSTPSSASAARSMARRRSIRPEPVDRRAMRFLGGGTAWNHVAMEQAIRDAGRRGERHLPRAHRHHDGLRRALDPTIVEAADTTRKNKSPKRIGPFAVPKAMSSTASATLATWFKIKGVNYSISSACATSNHCIGNAAGADPAGASRT